MITVTDDEARDAKVVNQMTLEQLERDMNDPDVLRHKEIIRRYKVGESYITIKRELDRLHPEWHTSASVIARVVNMEEKQDPTFQRRGTNYNKATGEVGHHKRPRISQPRGEKKPSPRTYFSDEDCINIWIKRKRGTAAEEIVKEYKIPAGRQAVYRVCSRVDHDHRLHRMAKREWAKIRPSSNTNQPVAQSKTQPVAAPKAADLIPSEVQVLEQELAYERWVRVGYEHGYINRYLRETKF